MSRSSGIPRRRGLGGISRIISSRATSKEIRRYEETTNSLGNTEQSLASEHIESLWLFAPNEGIGTEVVGEQLDGALNGLCVAADTVDLSHNDRVTHGGVEYEIDTIVGHPDDDKPDGTASPNTDFWVITFTRRQ
jgi:hypothetical protein